MKRAPRSLQHHVLYRKYNGQDSEISALLGKCGLKSASGKPGAVEIAIMCILHQKIGSIPVAQSETMGKAHERKLVCIG